MSMRVGEGGREFVQEVIIFRFDMIIFVFTYIEFEIYNVHFIIIILYYCLLGMDKLLGPSR